MSRLLVTARYAIPVPGAVIERPWLVIDGSRIAGLERFRAIDTRDATLRVIDCGDAVLLSGFVNAHCHLDLSHLKGRIPAPRTSGASFTDWLTEVAASRTRFPEAEVARGVEAGVAEALCGGTTAIGDVTATPFTWPVLLSRGLRGVVYFETLGLDPDAGYRRGRLALEQRLAAFDRAVGSLAAPRAGRLVAGVSPHAPYSTSARLYAACLAMMAEAGRPLCTHLAETRAETEFIAAGAGEFVGFLAQFFPNGVPALERSPSPAEFLATQVRALDPRGRQHPLVVHGNYCDVADRQRLRAIGANIVYCPRSHAAFGHDRYPLRAYLEEGLVVALGTDSLASNRSLSMLDELRFLAGQGYNLMPETLLKLATIYGARALGLEDQVGVLASGLEADCIAVAIPPRTRPEQVLGAVLHGDGPVRLALVGGELLHQAPDLAIAGDDH